jgi:hypothetical protein
MITIMFINTERGESKHSEDYITVPETSNHKHKGIMYMNLSVLSNSLTFLACKFLY